MIGQRHWCRPDGGRARRRRHRLAEGQQNGEDGDDSGRDRGADRGRRQLGAAVCTRGAGHRDSLGGGVGDPRCGRQVCAESGPAAAGVQGFPLCAAVATQHTRRMPIADAVTTSRIRWWPAALVVALTALCAVLVGQQHGPWYDWVSVVVCLEFTAVWALLRLDPDLAPNARWALAGTVLILLNNVGTGRLGPTGSSTGWSRRWSWCRSWSCCCAGSQRGAGEYRRGFAGPPLAVMANEMLPPLRMIALSRPLLARHRLARLRHERRREVVPLAGRSARSRQPASRWSARCRCWSR